MLGVNHSKQKGSRGFTLIELLVVIAIIAILAAILFPVFAKAKDNARLSRCVVHLGEIGKAVQQYCDDNDGRFPIGPCGSGYWTSQAYGGDTGSARMCDKKLRPLYKYTAGNMGIYKCTSQKKQYCDYGADTYPYDVYGNDYPMNGLTSYPAGGVSEFYTLMGDGKMGSVSRPAPRKSGDVRRPTKIVMVGERTMHYAWHVGRNGMKGVPLGHMSDRPIGPVVFCDGHTAVIRTPDIWDSKEFTWSLVQKGWVPGWPTVGI